MDNKAYLDSIAVKTQKNNNSPLSILTPTVIKLIAVGIVLIILMVVVGSILNRSNTNLKTSYEELFYTFKTLTNSSGPLYRYHERLKSSDVRAANVQLRSSLSNTYTQLQNVTAQIGVDQNSAKSSQVDSEIAQLSSSLERGFYAGTIDSSFANATYLQLSRMIALEESIRAQTDNDAVATIVEQSMSDLRTVQTQLKEYIDTH